MNVFCFTGNLGGDAEVRYTPAGMPVANFSVAVKSGYGDREQTMWVGCQLWGKRAEGGLAQYLKKGQSVAVSGELSVREYDRRDGTKGFSLEVRAQDVTLTGGNANGAPQQQHQQPAQAQQGQSRPALQQDQGFDSFDDDIPFAPIGKQEGRNLLYMI